jgi:hypothetical protein
MASTYTVNSGIELIANGEQSGTWGDTTNVNLQIIDRLTNGVGDISLSGTTHTLTTVDGSLSDGQYKVLVFGGSPSGTNTVTVSPNDQEKLFFVKNNSGQSVIISQGSGANVTVPNGESAVIYCDGAGAGAAVVNLSATFDLTTFLESANNLSDVPTRPLLQTLVRLRLDQSPGLRCTIFKAGIRLPATSDGTSGQASLLTEVALLVLVVLVYQLVKP